MRRWLSGRGRAQRVIDEVADGADPDAWLSLDVIYEQVTEELERQSRDWERLDDRLRFLLGVIGVVFAAALSLRAATAGGALVLVAWWVAAPAILAVVVFLLAAAIVAYAYQRANFNRPPNPVSLRDEYLLRDPRRTKLDIIDSINRAYNSNSHNLERKADAFNRALLLSAGATLLLGIAIIGQVLANADLAGAAALWSNLARSP